MGLADQYSMHVYVYIKELLVQFLSKGKIRTIRFQRLIVLCIIENRACKRTLTDIYTFICVCVFNFVCCLVLSNSEELIECVQF